MEDVANILYYVIENVLELVKFFLVDKYILGWQIKKWSWKRTVATVSGLLGIALFFSYLSEEINPFTFYMLFLIIETMISFQGVIWKLIFVTITVVYAINVMDVMINQMYEVLFGLMGNDIQLPMEFIVSATTILFLVVIIYAMKDKMQGYISKIPIRYYLIFICLDTGNGIILGEMQHNLEKGNVGLKIAFIFIVVGVFLELALILILAATREVYKERDLLNQKYLQLQESHYKYLEQRETATKKFRHDMRNHLYILQHLLEQGKQEEAKQYADEMEQHFNAMGTPISVNHGIIDAILNKYAAECEEKNIALSVKGYMPQECGISSFDLCVIFSNLLSNAIEAAENCAEKRVCLELRHEEGDFMLRIKNTYDGKLVEKDGSIQTRKQDKEMHGYGLANVKECVGRNLGHVDIQMRESEFVVSIYF